MRDIRSDLLERLEFLKKEEDSLRSKLSNVAAQRTAAEQLLAAEEGRFQGSLFNAPLVVGAPGTPAGSARRNGGTGPSTLSQMVTEALKDGNPWSLDRLAHMALERAIPYSGKSVKRSLNFCLQGLRNHGYVEPNKSGEWKWAKGTREMKT